jgi:GT2 family glycosyltransferase
LVDNQSRQKKTFDLINFWREKEPLRFRCLTLDEPFNFSVLNNHAVEYAKGDLLLFLNNDTEVISSDWLQELAGQALRPEIGAVGAMLLFKDGTIQHAGIILGGSRLAVHAHRGMNGDDPGYKGRLLSPSNVSALTAACMMVRKVVFVQAGGFDEHLPLAYNDVAFCLQLRRMDYYHIVLPQVKLFHYESQTRGYHFSASEKEQLQKVKEYLLNLYPELNNPDPYYSSNLDLLKENFR